ncbi:putative bifunctional diguanylate cyclase/phosphodiesterase [Desertimonas flava]|uniref:putative bifunctional diguanylate cyclase/phosphodiesterase n=1 Tax=Desertimonas flava TaxID=2064846 RepID=UPI000E346C29|nr:EAL domain-containing protein [Desertimonas flava]
MRDDLTDGVSIRRRAATWRWVVSVVVAAGLLLATVVVVIRAGESRSRTTVVVLGVAAGLALVAVAATWMESRRIARHLHRTIDRLIDTEAELRLLLDDLPEAVLSIDEDGLVRGANTKAAELAGRPIAEFAGGPLLRLFAPGDRDLLIGWLADGRSGPVEPLTLRLPRGDAAPITVEVSHDLPRSSERGAIVRLRDVSEREERVRALELARRRFQQAFHSAPTGMALVRLDNSAIVDANRSLADMLQRPIEDLVGRSIRDITHPDDLKAAAAYRARLELGIVDTYLLDQRYRRSDGEYIWARTRVAVTVDDQLDELQDGTGVPLAITHIEDVTEQLRTADQLRWAATHDDLTGLPNRTELLEQVDALMAATTPGSVALLFIDLDNFKTVNDSLGHGIGDHLLAAMARRLSAAVGPDTDAGDAGDRPGSGGAPASPGSRTLLGRFGGDEFIVVLTAPPPSDDGRVHPFRPGAVAERLRATIREAVDVDGTELFVTASIGYSVNHVEGTTAADLLRDADAAMYRAKARGRDCVEAYSPGAHESTALALRTATQLRRGLERGEIVPYYQPIVDLTTGHVIGFEVLARWLHPERGLLTPDKFLPLAEETGLVGAIGELVLRDGLAQLAGWRARELPFADAYLSVNVGTRQVVDPAFARMVSDVLAETGIPADSLWLEITETALLADVKASTVALRNLRSLGLHLAVDDFGTGYSSLTYLKRFPVEAIKIDRSFVAGLGLDTEDTTIVEAVINLGHSFGIGVIAEGLETPLQLSRLRALGCDRGQGYLFGRPRPANIVESERTTSS